jgi:MFS family permease
MPDPADRSRRPRLYRWRDPAIVALALTAMAAGFGQFGAVAALGDVARSFGHQTRGATIAEQAGLSGTKLGIGLAVLRLVSLGGLPLAGLADAVGRRITLLATCAVGLVLTAAAAASPGYWWFIFIFAVGRPALSATSAVAQVAAAEQTAASDRTRAVALIAAGYGIGTGLTAIVHALAGSILGFRGLCLLALVPAVLLPLVGRRLVESDRFLRAAAAEHALPVLGPIGQPFRRRLLIVVVLFFAVAMITGPANSFVFLYAQNVLHLSGTATAAMVIAAGASGLAGLLLGRWLADQLGRRPTAAAGLAVMAAFGVLSYSGSVTRLLVGFVLGVLAASIFAPAAGALVNELFPTLVRASVAGWQVAASVLGSVCGLLAFGFIADIGNRFGIAAAITFPPAALAGGLLLLLPETKGTEPEDLNPEPTL